MKSIARNWLPEHTGEAAVYAAFVLLLTAATYPVWRVVVFGVSIDDLLQLTCTSLLWG